MLASVTNAEIAKTKTSFLKVPGMWSHGNPFCHSYNM